MNACQAKPNSKLNETSAEYARIFRIEKRNEKTKKCHQGRRKPKIIKSHVLFNKSHTKWSDEFHFAFNSNISKQNEKIDEDIKQMDTTTLIKIKRRNGDVTKQRKKYDQISQQVLSIVSRTWAAQSIATLFLPFPYLFRYISFRCTLYSSVSESI